MLAAAANLDTVRDASAVEQFLRKHTSKGDDETWTAHHFEEGFAKIPELKELTTTPFMVKFLYLQRAVERSYYIINERSVSDYDGILT